MAVGKTWVFADITDGKPAPVALELITKARSLGGTVEAVAFSRDAEAAAAELGAHGAETLFAATDPAYGEGVAKGEPCHHRAVSGSQSGPGRWCSTTGSRSSTVTPGGTRRRSPPSPPR